MLSKGGTYKEALMPVITERVSSSSECCTASMHIKQPDASVWRMSCTPAGRFQAESDLNTV